MTITTPRWWYSRDRSEGAVTRIVMTPLSWLWAAATARRIATATPVDPGVPVISVGNLTMGGSGKTPVARAVLTLLREAGVEAHGLSRGYGGREAGPLRVDPDRHTAAEVGDEPLTLARAAPFWIARDRAAGARAAAEAGAKAVVLDDGHQNTAVAKTLSLIVVDGETRDREWPFGDGSVFPAGPMREPLKAGLARADAVILLLPPGLDAPDPELLRLFGATPILIARLAPEGPPPEGPLVGFAGVAKPWKVERALKAAGGRVVEFAPFPDHADFDEGALRYLEARARDEGATLITTDKDWARLSPEWRAKVTPWPVVARFDAPEAALAFLTAPLSRNRDL